MRSHMKGYVLLFLLASACASAQLVSIGALGGVPFLDQNQGGDESRRYIVGPSVEFRLPAGFAIEVDALYRRTGNTFTFNFPGNVVPIGSPALTFQINRQRGNYWQFPVLGKYYFRPRTAAWQPFLGTGWAIRTVGFDEDISQTILDSNGNYHSSSAHFHSRSDLGAGAIVAAGVRFHAGKFALTPQVRYTYWGSTAQFDLRRNEAGVFLGLSF
ncbi:MAG TPA: outer membrane beta-barrel protein [Bryobacteraceae bacterium]|nr:outer membrane beta-barrel protein [Bryobacteraceae bacterium]